MSTPSTPVALTEPNKAEPTAIKCVICAAPYQESSAWCVSHVFRNHRICGACAGELSYQFRLGLSVECNLDVSLSTLALLVWAVQVLLQRPEVSGATAAVLRDFAKDAARIAHFPPAIAKIIAVGWPEKKGN